MTKNLPVVALQDLQVLEVVLLIMVIQLTTKEVLQMTTIVTIQKTSRATVQQINKEMILFLKM